MARRRAPGWSLFGRLVAGDREVGLCGVQRRDQSVDVPSNSTAIGSAILTSLDAIAEVDNLIAPSENDVPLPSPPETTQQPQPGTREYAPHIIVLLTDGSSNVGPPPLIAAEKAAERGVRIYPIGFGTSNESTVDCGNPRHSDPSDYWRQGGVSGGPNTNIDFETLKKIAKRPAAFPRVLTTSAEKGTGIPGLRAEIVAACAVA